MTSGRSGEGGGAARLGLVWAQMQEQQPPTCNELHDIMSRSCSTYPSSNFVDFCSGFKSYSCSAFVSDW